MDQNGNKTGGRSKGTPNKIGSQAKELLENFLTSKLDPNKLESLYLKLRPPEQAQFILKGLQYVIPRQQLNEVNFNDLTPEQARQIILALIQDEHEKSSQ